MTSASPPHPASWSRSAVEPKTHSGADFYCAEAPRGSGKASLPRRPRVRPRGHKKRPGGSALREGWRNRRCPFPLPPSWGSPAGFLAARGRALCGHSSLAVQELPRVGASATSGCPCPARKAQPCSRPARPAGERRASRASQWGFCPSWASASPTPENVKTTACPAPRGTHSSLAPGLRLRQRGPVRDRAALELGSAGCRGHGRADTRQGPRSSGARNTSSQVAGEGTGRSWGRSPSRPWSGKGQRESQRSLREDRPPGRDRKQRDGTAATWPASPSAVQPRCPPMQDAPPPSHVPLSVLSYKQQGWVRAIWSLPGTAGSPTPRRGAEALARLPCPMGRSRRGCE